MAASASDVFQKVGRSTATTLSSPGYTIGNTSINVGSTTNWPTDTGITFAIDETELVNGEYVRIDGTYNIFRGTVNTATQITNVVYVGGDANRNYSAGATTRVYILVSYYRENRMVDGILDGHDQSGYHSKSLKDANGNEWLKPSATTSAVNEVTITNAATGSGPVISATGDDTNVDVTLKAKGTGVVKFGNVQGWSIGALPAVSSVTNNGNRSYNVTFNSSVASYLTPGQRIRTTRTSAAPTQCTSLNGTTQYWVKTTPNKLTFTNNFVCSGWVKLSSYGANSAIVSRTDGASGFIFFVNTAGQVILGGYNGAALGNNMTLSSYQSIPLNKWVHVAAQMDMTVTTNSATTNYIMIDGVDVPATATRAGTSPTSLTQAGNLNVGAYNGGTAPFPGKIAQVAIYNAKVTQANILATISQGLTGSETSLASAYSFNNSTSDLNTSTPNDLSAGAGSPTATNADSPFGGQADGTISSTLDYAEVLSVSTTVATVKATDANTIPTTGGVTSVDLSPWYAPYNYPNPSNRVLSSVIMATSASTASTSYVIVPGMTTTVTIPTGARQVKVSVFGSNIAPTGSPKNVYISLWDGTVGSGTQLGTSQITVGTANYSQVISLSAITTPTPGSHTYNVGFASEAASTTVINGSITAPVTLVVEYA